MYTHMYLYTHIYIYVCRPFRSNFGSSQPVQCSCSSHMEQVMDQGESSGNSESSSESSEASVSPEEIRLRLHETIRQILHLFEMLETRCKKKKNKKNKNDKKVKKKDEVKKHKKDKKDDRAGAKHCFCDRVSCFSFDVGLRWKGNEDEKDQNGKQNENAQQFLAPALEDDDDDHEEKKPPRALLRPRLGPPCKARPQCR